MANPTDHEEPTQVWVVKYDNGMYLFKSPDVVEASIRAMYPKGCTVERERASDQQYVYLVLDTSSGRIQDRIVATLWDVHQHVTTIHRNAPTEEDYDRPPQKPQEF